VPDPLRIFEQDLLMLPIVQLCCSGVRLPSDPLSYFQAAAVSRKFVIPVARKEWGIRAEDLGLLAPLPWFTPN
jgi:hypothetical protein